MNLNNNIFLKIMTKHAKNIINGIYDNSNNLFEFTDKNKYPDTITDFAESFGKMSVKLETREFDLEQKIIELENLINTRNNFSYIFINFVLIISMFIFINTIAELPEMISRIIEICVLASTIVYFFKAKITLKDLGLTFTGAKKSIVESLFISLLLMAGCLIFKIYLIKSGIFFKNTNIFDSKYFNLSDILIYIIIAPLQEFLARGAFLGSIQKVLSGKYKNIWSVILTSVIFGAIHIQYSIGLGLMALISGLIWGTLYTRHKTLIGISLSHYLVANWFIILGLWDMIN